MQAKQKQRYVFGGQGSACKAWPNMFCRGEGGNHDKVVRALRSMEGTSRPVPRRDEADADAEPTPIIVSVFPDPLGAYLSLEESSLSGNLGVSILIQSNYKYEINVIGGALRGVFGELDLQRFDRQQSEECFNQLWFVGGEMSDQDRGIFAQQPGRHCFVDGSDSSFFASDGSGASFFDDPIESPVVAVCHDIENVDDAELVIVREVHRGTRNFVEVVQLVKDLEKPRGYHPVRDLAEDGQFSDSKKWKDRKKPNYRGRSNSRGRRFDKIKHDENNFGQDFEHMG